MEPDGERTSVLGPALDNCVIELPVASVFAHRCSLATPAATGLGTVLAPGCTGADANGDPVRRQPGQCGLWTVGVRQWFSAYGVPQGDIIPSGSVSAPLSEQGMGPGRYPGRYAGPVRLLDAALDQEVFTNFALGGPTAIHGANRLLRDLGLGARVLPGNAMAWAWNGVWDDRNGNGVIDACWQSCSSAMANEFTWQGSCTDVWEAFQPPTIAAGVCLEDPNPNVVGSHACTAGEPGPCAESSLDLWLFPGTHGRMLPGDIPGNEIVHWVSCGATGSCYEEGDPLFGQQDNIAPEGTFLDRTGEPQESNRMWVGVFASPSLFIGDDGLLVTLVMVGAANCPGEFTDANHVRSVRLIPPGEPGGCTFLDVDKYPTVSPAVETLLVGDPDQPTGGVKGVARAAWLLIRDAADVLT